MAQKKKYHRYTSPIGVFVYPHLTKPDTKWKADGEFHTKVRFTPAAVQSFVDMAAEIAAEKLAEVIADKPKLKKIAKLAAAPFKPELDDDGDETGMLIGNFKMKHKVTKNDGTVVTFTPAIFDAKGKPTKANPWSGSEGRINFEMVPYFANDKNEAGVSLRLYGVQITKLVSGGQGDALSYGFGEVDGFSDDSDEGETTTKSGDAADAETGSAEDETDF